MSDFFGAWGVWGLGGGEEGGLSGWGRGFMENGMGEEFLREGGEEGVLGGWVRGRVWRISDSKLGEGFWGVWWVGG